MTNLRQTLLIMFRCWLILFCIVENMCRTMCKNVFYDGWYPQSDIDTHSAIHYPPLTDYLSKNTRVDEKIY